MCLAPCNLDDQSTPFTVLDVAIASQTSNVCAGDGCVTGLLGKGA